MPGICYGDTLALYLFAIVLDYPMIKAINERGEEPLFQLERRRSWRKQPVIITETDFADYISLISEEIEQAWEMLNSLYAETQKIGLFSNDKMIKAMLESLENGT